MGANLLGRPLTGRIGDSRRGRTTPRHLHFILDPSRHVLAAVWTGIRDYFPHRQIERPQVSVHTVDPATLRAPSAAERRSDRIKLRRGLTFLAMTLLLPGSAQLAAGNKRVGRTALRVWAGLWAAVLLFGLLVLVWRGAAIGLIAWPPTLRILQVALIMLAIGWGLLLMDAWRISRPPELARAHRLGFAVLNLALVALVAGALVSGSSIVSAQHDLVSTVFAGGGDTHKKAGRFNILLLGGDAGADRVGLRPDSLTVASIDADSGRTVLFSLPRNLEDVPFPASSPLHAVYPNGYTCADHSCLLNSIYTLGVQHKKLYPGVRDPGAKATKEAVEAVTGLQINYYALIDLKGFQALVDAVGGVRMDINKPIPIGGGSTQVKSYIKPGKNVHLDGYHALWFARSRHGSSDYERMVRQKCVMSAMLNQLDPVTVLTKFNGIAAAGKQIVATDVPPSDINTLMELAAKARKLPISSVAFVPPLTYPGSPNFDVIRQTVETRVEAAEATDRGERPAKKPKIPAIPAATGAKSSTPGSSQSKKAKQPKAPYADGDTENLGQVCHAG